MEFYAIQLVLFVMIFLRCVTLIALAPVLGHLSIPLQVKAALGMFMSFVLYPLMAARHPEVDLHLFALTLMAMQEVLTGLFIGFAMGLVFAGVRAAGELIGFDLGLSIATAFDPETGSNNIVGAFLYLVMLLVFILINGHHFVLQALVLSYDSIPIGGFTLSGPVADQLLAMSGIIFIVGLKCAAPIIVASFLMNVALAILARVAPQVNVFMVSFPVKIGVGLLVLMSAAPLIIFAFKHLLTGFEEDIVQLIRVM
jgi:flagellar biosynthesis protein FliR